MVLRFDLARHLDGHLSQMCTTPVRLLFDLCSTFIRLLCDPCTTLVRPLYDPCVILHTILIRPSHESLPRAVFMRPSCENQARLIRRSHDAHTTVRACVRTSRKKAGITHQLLHLHPRTGERVYDASGPIALPFRFLQDLDEIDMRLRCA